LYEELQISILNVRSSIFIYVFFKNLVFCEQDSKKKNFEEETVQLNKGKQKPSIQRDGPSFDVDKAKGSKKKNKASKFGKGKPGRKGRRARSDKINLEDSESNDTAIDLSKVNLESLLLYTAHV
jgi:hypothetical protein